MAGREATAMSTEDRATIGRLRRGNLEQQPESWQETEHRHRRHHLGSLRLRNKHRTAPFNLLQPLQSLYNLL